MLCTALVCKMSMMTATTTSNEPQVKHDAIVKQGTNRDKIVYSQLSNIKEKRGDAEKLLAPTADEAALTADRTRQAFEKVRFKVFLSCRRHPLFRMNFPTALIVAVGRGRKRSRPSSNSYVV